MNIATSSLRALSFVCLVSILETGCSTRDTFADAGDSTNPSEDAGNSSRETVDGVVTSDSLFPSKSLTDWVSYTEQLSMVTILREEEVPPPPEVLQRREGYIGRKVTVRVDETIWVNRGVESYAGEFEMFVLGWILQGETRIEATPRAAAPRIELNGKYVIPLVRYSRGWGPLTTDSVFAVPGEPVADADIDVHGTGSFATMLSGLSPDAIRQMLDATPRDPIAEKYWTLPPEQRVGAVVADEAQQQQR